MERNSKLVLMTARLPPEPECDGLLRGATNKHKGRAKLAD